MIISSYDFSRFLRFSFPQDPNIREAWINALQHSNQQRVKNLNVNSRVCENHFKCDDIRHNNCRSTLIKYSVPTIFPNSDGVDMEFLLLPEEENTVDLPNFVENPLLDSGLESL